MRIGVGYHPSFHGCICNSVYTAGNDYFCAHNDTCNYGCPRYHNAYHGAGDDCPSYHSSSHHGAGNDCPGYHSSPHHGAANDGRAHCGANGAGGALPGAEWNQCFCL